MVFHEFAMTHLQLHFFCSVGWLARSNDVFTTQKTKRPFGSAVLPFSRFLSRAAPRPSQSRTAGSPCTLHSPNSRHTQGQSNNMAQQHSTPLSTLPLLLSFDDLHEAVRAIGDDYPSAAAVMRAIGAHRASCKAAMDAELEYRTAIKRITRYLDDADREVAAVHDTVDEQAADAARAAAAMRAQAASEKERAASEKERAAALTAQLYNYVDKLRDALARASADAKRLAADNAVLESSRTELATQHALVLKMIPNDIAKKIHIAMQATGFRHSPPPSSAPASSTPSSSSSV